MHMVFRRRQSSVAWEHTAAVAAAAAASQHQGVKAPPHLPSSSESSSESPEDDTSADQATQRSSRYGCFRPGCLGHQADLDRCLHSLPVRTGLFPSMLCDGRVFVCFGWPASVVVPGRQMMVPDQPQNPLFHRSQITLLLSSGLRDVQIATPKFPLIYQNHHPIDSHGHTASPRRRGGGPRGRPHPAPGGRFGICGGAPAAIQRPGICVRHGHHSAHCCPGEYLQQASDTLHDAPGAAGSRSCNQLVQHGECLDPRPRSFALGVHNVMLNQYASSRPCWKRSSSSLTPVMPPVPVLLNAGGAGCPQGLEHLRQQ